MDGYRRWRINHAREVTEQRPGRYRHPTNVLYKKARQEKRELMETSGFQTRSEGSVDEARAGKKRQKRADKVSGATMKGKGVSPRKRIDHAVVDWKSG